MNDSFILYTSYYSIIEGLSDAQLGQLMRALFLYARDGEQIQLEPVVRMAFAFIKDNLDRNADKYQKKCERLRANAKKRWEEKQLDTNVNKNIQLDNKNTNASNCMQLDANASNCMLYDNDNVNDNVNVSDNDVISNDNNIIKPSKEGNSKSKNEFLPPEPSSEKSSLSKKQGVDAAAIKDYWNSEHDKTNSSMRRLTLMSENRKTMLRARLRQCNGDVSLLYKAIDMSMASDFMNGNNSRGWTASFDWIFGNENNFAKTLEGYDDKPARPPKNPQQPQQSLETGKQSIGERYKQAENKHVQPTDKDNKYRAVISTMLDDLRKNPRNQAAKNSLARYYEEGILQRLGIDWKPE